MDLARLLNLRPNEPSEQAEEDEETENFAEELTPLALFFHLLLRLPTYHHANLSVHCLHRLNLVLPILSFCELKTVENLLASVLLVDLVDDRCQTLLILAHLLAHLDPLFVFVEDIDERDRVHNVEQEQVAYAGEHHHLEGCIARWEQRQNCLHTWVRLLVLLDECRDVLEDEDFVDAEHDADSHAYPDARLLLLRPQDRLGEGKHDVEEYSEAEPPIDLNIGVIRQVNAQVVPRVLVPASLPFQALLGLENLVESALVFRIFARVELLLHFVEGNVDLVR